MDILHDYALYYEKASPVRPWIISKYMAFKLYTLGISAVAAVVVGREQWLFVGHETEKVDELRYFLGLNLMADKEMARWLRVLSARRRWLEKMGIAYLLVIAPNKSSIYPEYMPAIYPRGQRTRLDQLSGFMARRSPDFPMLDLRPAMKSGKKRQVLYWTTDSHWNDFGRNLAYREIVARLAVRFPSLKALAADAFEARPCPEPPHDLEDLLLLPWRAGMPAFRLVPRSPLPSTRITATTSPGARQVEIFRARAASLPLALIIHDSFGQPLKPLLGCHFRRSRWILDRSHSLPAAWIESRRPSLVIDEIAERYLEEDPWTNPAAIGE